MCIPSACKDEKRVFCPLKLELWRYHVSAGNWTEFLARISDLNHWATSLTHYSASPLFAPPMSNTVSCYTCLEILFQVVFLFSFYLFGCVSVWVYVCVCPRVHVCGGQDSLQESGLSLHHMVSRELRPSWQVASIFTHWAISPTPGEYFPIFLKIFIAIIIPHRIFWVTFRFKESNVKFFSGCSSWLL